MNKRGAISLLWLLLFLFCIRPASAGTGDLQVTCDPGVRVFVDNAFKGVSKESEGGLFVSDLTPGQHTVKVLKKGAPPFEKTVDIKAFEAVEVVVKFGETAEKAVPLTPATGETAAPTGTLALRSAPLGALVSIDGEKKSGKTDMRIEHIRAGQHTILFQRDGRDLSGTFTVEPDTTLELKADFKSGVIVNISELKRKESEKGAETRQEQPPQEQAQQQPAAVEPGPAPVPGAAEAVQPAPGGAEQAPQPVQEPEAVQPPQQPMASETAKPYGELLIEVVVSRETVTAPYRDTLLIKFPDHSVPPDVLLDSHFLDKRDSGDTVKYKTDSNGRTVSTQFVIGPQEEQVSKTGVFQVSVKEGTYNLAVRKKRWRVDFYTDRKIAEKVSLENIVIKRGEKLHVKIQYAPDKTDTYDHSIERTYEAIDGKFYENIDTLLTKNR